MGEHFRHREQQEAKLEVGLGGTSRQVGRVPGAGCLLGVCWELRDHMVAEALGPGAGELSIWGGALQQGPCKVAPFLWAEVWPGCNSGASTGGCVRERGGQCTVLSVGSSGLRAGLGMCVCMSPVSLQFSPLGASADHVARRTC